MNFLSFKYKNLTDEELFAHIQKSKVAAFNELYDRYATRLLNYFYKMLGNDKEKAQDFVQDIFVKIIDNQKIFDPTKKFSVWIYTVAGNMCKNEYRRMQSQKRSSIEEIAGNGYLEFEGDDDVVEKMANEEFNKEILKKVDLLSEDKKSVFLLRFQQDLSLKEISNICDCSIGTVKSRLHYTVKTLAKELKNYEPTIEQKNEIRM